jgi:hypothetical protein
VTQLESLITAESKPIVFDMKEVNLVSREVVQFLVRCENDGLSFDFHSQSRVSAFLGPNYSFGGPRNGPPV